MGRNLDDGKKVNLTANDRPGDLYTAVTVQTTSSTVTSVDGKQKVWMQMLKRMTRNRKSCV